MKIKCFLLLMVFFPVFMMAQEATIGEGEVASPWSHKGLAGLNFSQSSFTNWSEGGENSMMGNVYFNASLNYVKGKNSWTNDLDANFGMLKTEENPDWRKNMDNIHYASKFGRTITQHFYYASLLDFRTQFASGYDYATTPKTKVSDFMTPAYLNISIGVDYKPNNNLSIYYSPVSGKMTFVNDTLFSVAYGLAANNTFKAELGSTLKATVNYDFFDKKLSLKSNLNLFTAYNESFGKVDVNWDLLVGFNLTKLLTLTFQSTLKYDDDIKTYDESGHERGAKVQFKEILGVGISYKF